MAWAGGVWNTTYGTSTGSISMGMQIYYDRKFLSRAKENLYMDQFAQLRPIPEGSGKQIRFFRYHDIDTLTSPLTEGQNPDPTAVTGHELNATLEEWGAFSQHSSLVSRTHIDRGLSQLAEIWGDNAGRSIDLRIMKEVVANGAYPIRVDGEKADWTFAESGTTASTTTVIYCDTITGKDLTDLDQTNNFWIGATLIATSGKNYGQARYVSDSDGTAKSVTVTLPFENAPEAGDTFVISHVGVKASSGAPVSDAMDTGDILTHKAFQKTWERLKLNKTMPFRNGYYILLIGPTVHANFMSDTTWTGLEQYHASGPQGLFKGEAGTYMGFKVVTTTQPFQCTLPTNATTGGPGQSSTTHATSGSNYSATGTAHYNLAIGREAFGCTKFPGYKTPKIIVKNPGPQDTSNPLNRFSTVGWELPFVPVALNAKWCVAPVSGG